MFLLLSSTACWALPQCRGENTSLWNNCYGIGYWEGQGTLDGQYTGEFRHGQRHGWGIYEWTNGNRYEGQWMYNQKQGYGTETSMEKKYEGDYYVGEYKANLFDGKGTYYYVNLKFRGDIYVGQFKKGQKYGEGIYSKPNGERYEGIWENDEFKYAKKISPENARQEYFTGPPTSNGHNSYPVIKHDSNPYSKRYGEYEYDVSPERDGYSGPDYDYYPSETIAEREEQERLAKKEEKQIAKEKKQIAKEKKQIAKEKKRIAKEKKQAEDNKTYPVSSGTGFAITGIGHVVTNYHVIRDCKNIFVHYQGEQISTFVVNSDPTNDLSLIKADFKPTKVFPLSKDTPYLMQDVHVAGYPFGWAYSKSLKVTSGSISSLFGEFDNSSKLQFDAALQVGNSGGPVYDSKGNVVAVATEKISYIDAMEKFDDIPENQNYGVKSNVVIMFLESNRIKLKTPNTKDVERRILGKTAEEATYFLSCWMTVAQIKEEIQKDKKIQKVMFKNIIEEFK